MSNQEELDPSQLAITDERARLWGANPRVYLMELLVGHFTLGSLVFAGALAANLALYLQGC